MIKKNKEKRMADVLSEIVDLLNAGKEIPMESYLRKNKEFRKELTPLIETCVLVKKITQKE